MFSRPANESLLRPLSPQSVDSIPSAAGALPDPNEIANLLSIKGHHTPTYDAASRESTPFVVADEKQWIHRNEALQKSISSRSTTFVYEEWRQKNILDNRYWQIEADYYESCYNDNFSEKCQQGQSWQERDLLRTQQAQHNICFFEHANQFDWLSRYTQLATKRSATPQDEIYKLVFDTIYHYHRARYWQDLCEKRGYTHARKSIEAIYYWQTEFGYLLDETVRLEKESLEKNGKPAPRKRVARKRNINRSSSAEAKNSGGPRGGSKKGSKVSSKPTGIQKSYKLRDRTVKCK
jgi:hypothetical protein